MLILVIPWVLGYNVNLPQDPNFVTAPVVPPTRVHNCVDGALNVTNQYPQALIEVTGMGGGVSCDWSARKIVVPVTDNMPAAGAIRAVTAGVKCPLNMMCPPSPCTMLEMDYQNYYDTGTNNLANTIIGATNCGPMFGRGKISGKFKLEPDVDVLNGADKDYYPGFVRTIAADGDNDVPGFTAQAQLIQSHPRYEDVSVPVWANIDGLGKAATGSYDFVQLSYTLNPSKGWFCDNFRATGYDKNFNPGGQFSPQLPSFNFSVKLTEWKSITYELTNTCRSECESAVLQGQKNSTIDIYMFMIEIVDLYAYGCDCWIGDQCTKASLPHASWLSSDGVGTTFVQAHSLQIVRSGKTAGNLPVRRISDIDKTSEFVCPNSNGVKWDLTFIGVNQESCKVHGYENHLMTCACFKYMLYQTEQYKPPHTSCCRWFTAPMVRTGPGFKPFDRQQYKYKQSVQNASVTDAAVLNRLLLNLTDWTDFWTTAQSTVNSCWHHDCVSGRDAVTVLLAFNDRLAPCCPWFKWSDRETCKLNNGCNFGGIDVGCTMTANDLISTYESVPDYEDLCQKPAAQTDPYVLSQFAKTPLNDFARGSAGSKSVPFGHINRPISNNQDELLTGLGKSTDVYHSAFKRVMPFIALNPGAGASPLHGEVDVASALFAVFHTYENFTEVVIDAALRGQKAPIKIWSRKESQISAADPCWQLSKPATLSVDYEERGSIKEIVIVIDQSCELSDICTSNEVLLMPGSGSDVHVSIPSTPLTVEPLPEHDIESIATVCQFSDCNTSWIPLSAYARDNATLFWARYAVTTGVFIDDAMKPWAQQHDSADTKHDFCRWHYPISTGGWKTSPYPHTLPCAKRCRPLTYRKSRTYSCGSAKAPVQQNPHINAHLSDVRSDYHGTRPTIGYQSDKLKTSTPKYPYWSTTVYPNSRPSYNPFNWSETLDISIEVCGLASLFKSEQHKCIGNRANRMKQRIKFIDYERSYNWEGWAMAKQVCEQEIPFKSFCEFDDAAIYTGSANMEYQNMNDAAETGYSKYDLLCKRKDKQPDTPFATRFCEISVWTHERTTNTKFDNGACLQEVTIDNYTPDEQTKNLFNLYTPTLILGDTYNWLGPRPRVQTLKAGGITNNINPAYEFYNQNDPEGTGRKEAPDYCNDRGGYVSFECNDGTVCDQSPTSTQEKHEQKIGGRNCWSTRKLGTCKKHYTDPGAQFDKECDTMAFINTVANVQVPVMDLSLDQQFLQTESFENTLYACRCSKPGANGVPFEDYDGKTLPLTLNAFNNKPAMYIKCCATDEAWNNLPPELDDPPDSIPDNNKFKQRQPSDWARTESPKFRWVNYFDGIPSGTANQQAQCGAISPESMVSPNYMPTVENGKIQRPKLDTVSPRGFSATPQGPQQFVIKGIKVIACGTNSASNVSTNAKLLGPLLAPVSHVTQDEPFVPDDYIDRPYFVEEPNQKQPQMCDCEDRQPVYACQRYTDDSINGILPNCVGQLPKTTSATMFNCVVCGWTWSGAIEGVTFPLGLFIGHYKAGVKSMERDSLYSHDSSHASVSKDFLRFFMAPGAPTKPNLVELISDVGQWGGDFDKRHVEKRSGATSPNQKVTIVTYPGTCLRPPYGRTHRNALSDEDKATYFKYSDSEFQNGGLSSRADETLYLYCEQPSGRYVYCNNDPLGSTRNEFCTRYKHTVDRLLYGHTINTREFACNSQSKLCLYIQNDPKYQTFQSMGIMPDATVLIFPLSWDVLSAVQCSQSIAKFGTGHSMGDQNAQSPIDGFFCDQLVPLLLLESFNDMVVAYHQLIQHIDAQTAAVVCATGLKAGPPAVSGEIGTSPVQCYSELYFTPLIATRNNQIQVANVTIKSLNGQPIQIPSAPRMTTCAVFLVEASHFFIEPLLYVDNTGCDSKFGGAAIHFSGDTAAHANVMINMVSENMAVSAVGYDEINGEMSRVLLDVTGMQISLYGNLNAPFSAAMSRVTGNVHSLSCNSSCRFMLYESHYNPQFLPNFTNHFVDTINVSQAFNQFALAPLRTAHHYWAGKLREVTIIYFTAAAIVATALVFDVIRKTRVAGATKSKTS